MALATKATNCHHHSHKQPPLPPPLSQVTTTTINTTATATGITTLTNHHHHHHQPPPHHHHQIATTTTITTKATTTHTHICDSHLAGNSTPAGKVNFSVISNSVAGRSSVAVARTLLVFWTACATKKQKVYQKMTNMVAGCPSANPRPVQHTNLTSMAVLYLSPAAVVW